MPQIIQLSDVLYSQLFWLLVTLAVIYVGIGRAMVPKIEATIESRDARIAEDLAAAESARREADATEEAYRERMNESRAQALKVTGDAKQSSARAREARVAEAEAANRDKLEAAEKRLRAATETAMADIESVAAEAAQEMVAKLGGISVSRDEAAQAVKAELVHG
jgi:F-type H+-transporting ATPase subunit b